MKIKWWTCLELLEPNDHTQLLDAGAKVNFTEELKFYFEIGPFYVSLSDLKHMNHLLQLSKHCD